jgi:hypothetical protein
MRTGELMGKTYVNAFLGNIPLLMEIKRATHIYIVWTDKSCKSWHTKIRRVSRSKAMVALAAWYHLRQTWCSVDNGRSITLRIGFVEK